MLLRRAITVCSIYLLAFPSYAAIRDINFKEFSYPWAESMKMWSRVSNSEWGWIEGQPESTVRLVEGRHDFVEPDVPRQGGPYLFLQSVTFGDITGDAQEEAAIDLRYGTGGTMNWHYLYVYTLSQDSPKLLGLLESGSRADGGLVNVTIENGLLVLDFSDSGKRRSDCCSDGFVRVRYRWADGRFVETGDRYYEDFERVLQASADDRQSRRIKSTADVQYFEAVLHANPEDLEARKMLLDWYFDHLDDPATPSVRLRHVLWTIEHHTDMPLVDYFERELYRSSRLESHVLLVDEREQDAFSRVRQAWLAQVQRQPSNTVILYRAAIALSRSDPGLAAEWFKRVIQSDSGARVSTARQLLGRLYADAVMGVVARTPTQAPGQIDEARAKSDSARIAKDEIEHSTDALVVAEAASWLYETCSYFLGRTRKHSDYDLLAWEWLKRAEALDNAVEVIEMYENDLYGEHSLAGLPPRPPRIKLSAVESPQPLSTVAATCPPGVNILAGRSAINVRVIIATDGHVRFALRMGLAVTEISRLRDAGYAPLAILESALEAARQYRFPLTYRNGIPVEVETTITVVVCK